MPETVNTVTFQQTQANQIVRISTLLRLWAERSLKLEGATDKETKKNINAWLDDFEKIYTREMLKIKDTAGLQGYALGQKDGKNMGAIDETAIGIDEFLDKYQGELDKTHSVDSTNIRNFRNSLGTRWKKDWKNFYKEWDAVINKKSSLGLSFRKLTEQVRNRPWYRDLVSIVDGSGRKWSPDTYSAMYANTQASTFKDNIHVDELQDVGVEYIRISDHNTSTPICKQYEGKIFALSSNSLGVPVISIRPPFHPNCRHVTLATRPDRASGYKENNKKVDKQFKAAKADFPKNWQRTVDKQEKYNLLHRKPLGGVPPSAGAIPILA
jgi:hypothetical protein